MRERGEDWCSVGSCLLDDIWCRLSTSHLWVACGRGIELGYAALSRFALDTYSEIVTVNDFLSIYCSILTVDSSEITLRVRKNWCVSLSKLAHFKIFLYQGPSTSYSFHIISHKLGGNDVQLIPSAFSLRDHLICRGRFKWWSWA